MLNPAPSAPKADVAPRDSFSIVCIYFLLYVTPISAVNIELFGAPEGTRTPNLDVRSVVL